MSEPAEMGPTSGDADALPPGPDVLAAAGLSAADDHAYRAVLAFGDMTASDVAAITGMGTGMVRRALASLIDAGLVMVTGRGRVRPVPPELGIARLITERQTRLEEARLLLHELAAAYHKPVGRITAEVIEGRDAARQVAVDVAAIARETLRLVEVRGATVLPDRGGAVTTRHLIGRGAAEVIGASRLHAAEQQGHAVALIPDPPCAVLIADHTHAALVSPDGKRAVLLADRPAVPLLVFTFEMLWRTATVLGGQPEGDLPRTDRRLLDLLASGLTDEAVARQLGVSSRTVVRRVARLIARLGVDTRFQAGAAAQRRGWLATGGRSRPAHPGGKDDLSEI